MLHLKLNAEICWYALLCGSYEKHVANCPVLNQVTRHKPCGTSQLTYHETLPLHDEDRQSATIFPRSWTLLVQPEQSPRTLLFNLLNDVPCH